MGEAVAELRQALALNPELTQARLILARVYLDLARASRARDELQVALEKVPNDRQLLTLLAEAERQLGNPKRTVELTRQVLAIDPEIRPGAVLPRTRAHRSPAAGGRDPGAGAGRRVRIQSG